jgi:hypothetical protein
MPELLPYAHRGESISVSLDFLGTPNEEVGEKSFLVDPTKLNGPFDICVEAQLPSGISGVFPPAESANPPMSVIAAVKSIDGLIRKQISLQRKKNSLYTGIVTLDPEVISESAKISVYAVRSSQGPASPGFARQKGVRLAWAPIVEVRMAKMPPPGGKHLRILWEDFDESTIVPAGFAGAFFYLDTNTDDIPPVLYLNRSAKPALVKLAETRGHGHPKALPRDVIFRSIAVTVWTALVQAALEALLREAGENGEVDFENTFAGRWKGEVLKWAAPVIWPTVLPKDALKELCMRINEDGYYTQVMARAQLGIQVEENLLGIYEQFAEDVFRK